MNEETKKQAKGGGFKKKAVESFGIKKKLTVTEGSCKMEFIQ